MLIQKFVFFIKFFFLTSFFISAQNDSTIIRLTLNQFLDSALANHPDIRNAKLNVFSAKSSQYIFPDIKPTEIIYGRGQMFSSFIDRDFEIKQNIGSPLTWIFRENYNKNLVALKEEELRLIKSRTINKIKAAYYSCIFELNKVYLLNKQKSLYDDFISFQKSDFIRSDDSLSAKIIAETQFYDIQNQLDISYNDFLLAKTELLRAAYISSDIEPVEEELKMYEVAASNDTSDRAPGNLIKSFYKQQCTVSGSALKLQNSKFFPEITLGYFNQTIYQKSGYSGWQVGVAVPLWYFPQSSKNKEAQIQKKISENEYERQQFDIKKNSEYLMIKLNKYFERLNYFYNNALKNADEIEEIAINRQKSGNVDFSDFVQKINTAYKIRLDYLETLNNYNQTAIELEMYTY